MTKTYYDSKIADSFFCFYSRDALTAAEHDAKCWLLPVLESDRLWGAARMVLTLIQ